MDRLLGNGMFHVSKLCGGAEVVCHQGRYWTTDPCDPRGLSLIVFSVPLSVCGRRFKWQDSKWEYGVWNEEDVCFDVMVLFAS